VAEELDASSNAWVNRDERGIVRDVLLGRRLCRRRRGSPRNDGARAARANRCVFVRLAALSSVAAAMLAGTSVTAATLAPGSPDPTWGSGGRVATSLGVTGPEVTIALTGAVLLPDGKVVAEAEDVNSCPNPCVHFVARYTPTGALDSSFGKRGVVTLANGQGVGPLAALPDGTIVVGNVRLDADGSVDASFHPPPTPAGPQRVWAVHVLPGGGLLESSTVYRTSPRRALFGLFRLQAGGKLDRSFGTLGGGTVTAVGNPQYGNVDPYGITAPRAVALTTGGNIVVAGEAGASATNGAFALLEYGPTGKLDPRFGTNGVALTRVSAGGAGAWPAGVPLGPGAGAGASAVVLLPNGRLLVAGYAQPNDFTAGARIALARYLPNGTLDTTFGSAGIVVTPLYTAGSDDPPVDLVAIAGGKFLVGPHNGYTTIARINANGSLDPTFGSGGTINPKIQYESLLVQPDGKIIVAGIGGTSGKAAIVVRRYLG
jgi:uncharacterized delta-60 repeat protein